MQAGSQSQNQNGAPSGFSAESARLLRSLLPLLPDVTQQILPEVISIRIIIFIT
jgi:hypothetical protein